MSDKQTAPSLPPLIGGGGNNVGASQQTVRLQQVLATAQGLNVLTTGGGQQFVITSQVPGLAQVLPAGSITTTAGGVTRIVNISNSPRTSVVGVAGASNSPTRQGTTKVVLSTSPKLVKTLAGNVFVTPSVQNASQTPPARKRLRLSESTEKVTTIDDSLGYRRRIMEHKMKRMRAIREKYAENASELFFLHAGGNMMDFQNWRKRSSTPQYVNFLKQHRLDPDDDEEDLTAPIPAISDLPTPSITPNIVSNVSNIPQSSQGTEVKISGAGVTPVAVSTTLPAAVAQLSQQGGTPIVPDPPKPVPVVAPSPVAEKIPVAAGTSTKVTKATTVVTATSQPVVKLVKLPASTIVSSSDMVNNQEQIVEKAKQEAYVMQRISELQREGLWSERRLPKVQEPSRTKAHWDYLLEEMVWLAADFAQERKWKKAAAKKCARMVQKHFQEKAVQAQKAEKSQELRLKKIAGFVAKEIKTFWANVEKLVEFKQQTRLEEKRKKALDQHLNFIVGQTEKYSTWLTEGLNKTDGAPSVSASMNSSRISSPVTPGINHSDDEFEPNQSSDDDEETIAKAEEEMKSTTNHMEEVEMLKRESELPLEDLLKELPPNYLEERDKSLSPCPKDSAKNTDSKATDGDEEFVAASDESSDDEDTIMEQEKLEYNQDHKQELNDLKEENEMSIEELMAKYGNFNDASMEVDEESGDEESSKEEDEDKEEDESEVESESEDETKEEGEDDSQTQSDEETNVGLKSLLEDLSVEKSSNDKTGNNESLDQSDQARNEMDDVAALAESIQPKGNTLLTTSVVTKIPFLLKHSLREYQHIGLDWLVTMFERKLNGILADEMGLGKTIQTIALLAHLACEKGNWGPHLIIVPTSVMLNWEMECKKWCPGFKILTYYGTQKERKQKRTGWTKPNAFHICITSYKLVIQDHQSFRRKKWKYLILDEAQNIKNFKSQRWQLLLNFQTQRRLLLTGTPLQNNLMELWSLMHFLMPNVFQSHREFKEWFSNPVTGMIEGNSEYNENIIRRLHKVLRPFLLRRLKTEVEKQLPKKYEHVVMCRLSKRQRYLYDDFMSRAKTRETLASGNLLSVINVLMQLRKVCNHPNLFEVRPTVSPFQMEAIEFVTASLAWSALDYDPFKHVDLSCLNLFLVDLELTLSAFVAHRVRRFQTPRKLIEEIDSQPDVLPRCPSGKIKINVRLSNQSKVAPTPSLPPLTSTTNSSITTTTTTATTTTTSTTATNLATPNTVQQTKLKNISGILPNTKVGTSPLIKSINNQTPSGQGVTLRVATGQPLQGYSVQLVQHQGSVKAIPVATLPHTQQTTATSTPTTAAMNAQRITVGNANIKDSLQRLTTQTVTVKQGDSVQRIAVPSFAQLVQTSTGRHIILTSNQQNTNTVSIPVMTSSGQRLTVLSKSLMGLTTSVTTVNRVMPGGVVTTSPATSGRPIMRVPPLNVTTSLPQTISTSQNQPHQQQQQFRCGIVTRNSSQTVAEKNQVKEVPKSEFYLPQVEEERRQRRQSKLQTLANINDRRCAACPLYGEDLFDALRIAKPVKNCCWHGEGWLNCDNSHKNSRTRREFFSRTEALAEAIKSTELIVQQLQEVFERFVVYVPAVRAPMPRFHVSHPPPHKLWANQRLSLELQRDLSPKLTLFHPVASAMSTQFPDPRLIQYDCGKLQSLDRLLRTLKTGSHRVLIFTQMTRMLDVLEAFLNFHGHIYLRLDGATKVDQRQVLMERFNGDKRIFCFILSTRSGGVGVNLTGADTVIFYDSDWNPTMDAQAQDRCHRIGQTRDVHIYRLVSEKTVEENILKKANQKRLLGDLAIEGGNFTTAYFKSSTIQDLFNVDQAENDASTRMAEVLERSKDREKILREPPPPPVSQQPVQPSEEKAAMGALESALAAAEEDLDVQAAKTAKAEAVADLAEFDENIPLDDPEKEDTQVSKAEQEVQHLVQQLSPIERYAMKFVEESEGSFSAAQLAAAEKELEQQKKEWELGRLRALREEEERRMRLADDDEKPLTFGREDSQNQVNNTSNSKKLVNKKTPPSRRSSRRTSQSVRESSESETETTDSESESQEDQVEDSPDEESSHTESQSQEDEDEEDEEEEGGGGGRRQNESKGTGRSKNRSKSNRSNNKSRWDLNSPRTRSRGDVKINLWTLDIRPILPGLRPVYTPNSGGPPRKRGRPRSDEVFMPPPPPDILAKKNNNTGNLNNPINRRPDTPLPTGCKKNILNLDSRSQNRESNIVNNRESFNCKEDSNNDDCSSNTKVKIFDNFNSEEKFSNGDSNNLTDKIFKLVESTLIFNIKSDSNDDGIKSDVPKSIDGDSDNRVDDKVDPDKAESPSPLNLKDGETCDSKQIQISEAKFDNVDDKVAKFSPPVSPEKTKKNFQEEILDRNVGNENSVSQDKFVAPKPVALVENFEEADLSIDNKECNQNSNIQSNNSTELDDESGEKLNSVSDSNARENAKSKTRSSRTIINNVKSSRAYSPAPVTRSKFLSRSKSRSLSPIVVPVPRSVIKSITEPNKVQSSDNEESEIHDPSLQDVDKAAASSVPQPNQKSNINCVNKSNKISRPDTPLPGVTTRNKSLTLNSHPNTPPILNRVIATPNVVQNSNYESRRITRSGGNQITCSNINTNKCLSKIGRFQRPDTPFPVSDVGRVTRSGISRPVTPLPQKTPKIQTLKVLLPQNDSPILAPNQINRNSRSLNSGLKPNSSTSREPSRFPKRNSVAKSDGEFRVPIGQGVRKSKSTPSMKLNSEMNLNFLGTRSTRRLQPSIGVVDKFIAPQRRPDTPLPRSIRVTRSTANSDLLPQSSSRLIPSLVKIKENRKSNSDSESREIRDSNSNSEPSSSNQDCRPLSPKLRTKFNKKEHKPFMPSPLTNDNDNPRVSNTDSNANAVDPLRKIKYSKFSLSLRKLVPPTVKPDSTTKNFDNNSLKSFLNNETDKIDARDAKKEEYCGVREINNEPVDVSTSYHFTELSIREKAQHVLSKSKFRLGNKNSNYSSGDGKSAAGSNLTDENRHSNADDYSFESPALQKMKTYSNSYMPKSFVRVNKIAQSSKQNSDSDNANSTPETNKERQSLASADSTVVTYIDLDNEPEYMPPPKKYRRKKKLTRITPLTKPLTSNKQGKVEVVEIVEEEEKKTHTRFGNKKTSNFKNHHLEKSNIGPVAS